MLINRNGFVKLCDFGVSGQLDRSLAKTNIGCQSYMAVSAPPGRVEGATDETFFLPPLLVLSSSPSSPSSPSSRPRALTPSRPHALTLSRPHALYNSTPPTSLCARFNLPLVSPTNLPRTIPPHQPERIKGESQGAPTSYTASSDVWSLGLSIIEFAIGHYPYPPETYSNVFAQLTAIVHGDPPVLPPQYSETAQDFVSKCLRKVANRRPSYKELLVSPFVPLHRSRWKASVEGVEECEPTLTPRM